MKKRLTLAALLALAIFGLVNCGRNSSDENTTKVPSLVQRTAATNAAIAQVSR